MRTLSKLVCAACLLACGCLPLQGQVYPVPFLEVISSRARADLSLSSMRFFPALGLASMARTPSPTGSSIPRVSLAVGYIAGTATDSAGNTYNIGTDIPVYEGNYVGAIAHDDGGDSDLRQGTRHVLVGMTGLLRPQFGVNKSMISTRRSRPTVPSGLCKSPTTGWCSAATHLRSTWRTWPSRTRLRSSVRSGYRRHSRLTSPIPNRESRVRSSPPPRIR